MSVANERTSEAKCPQGGAKGGIQGAPTNTALKGGFPESVSSRSAAEKRISRIIGACRSVVPYIARARASYGIMRGNFERKD